MRKIDKLKQIEKANLLAEQRFMESKGLVNEEDYSDGDADIEINNAIETAILGSGEGTEYPTLTPVQIIKSGIDYARNPNIDVHSERVAKVVAYLIKGR